MKIRFTLEMPVEQRELLNELAHSARMTSSRFVRHLIEQHGRELARSGKSRGTAAVQADQAESTEAVEVV